MGPARRDRAGAEDNKDASAADAGGSNRGKYVSQNCGKCREFPPAGKKLHICSGCQTARYCSSVCQREDWPNHKLVCAHLSTGRERVLEDLEQQGASAGSAKRKLKRDNTELYAWFDAVPGLSDKVDFLAWTHRHESPILTVITPSTSVDSVTDVTVVIVPRTEWDHDVTSAFTDALVIAARATLERSDMSTDKEYLAHITIERHTTGASHSLMTPRHFNPYMCHLHSSVLMTLSAEEFAAEMLRCRNDSRLGIGSGVYVLLTGLRSAAHLNGREGVLRGRDPHNLERFTVAMAGSADISVRSQNYVLVQRPKLFNDEF
mmetsp:Transcript_44855/g.72018  ORF Transcript_44855/g.72018 Transcript_44855/m.72018 type:complete len:319 (+) Transcript_44855:295-1251(+)|eukprot:CAMPEP_0198691362 /NCGR_PEP_ID=MMETSP1468-20131203/201727_1 /TAXON_ID=1461545 /ORGANISM="Mantoniella sp, Strain CCMP1436" /LENGTH=318 /DNA_ID=CAMNT_0044444491 /DNA_START=418 /DNA_END=1374 /DNA_ORIENTATION=+